MLKNRILNKRKKKEKLSFLCLLAESQMCGGDTRRQVVTLGDPHRALESHRLSSGICNCSCQSVMTWPPVSYSCSFWPNYQKCQTIRNIPTVQFNYGSPENTRTSRSATSSPFSSQMRAGYNMKESGDDVACCLEHHLVRQVWKLVNDGLEK